MCFKYALQWKLPSYPFGEKLKWENVAYSNSSDRLICQLTPNSRVINIETKEVIAECEVQKD